MKTEILAVTVCSRCQNKPNAQQSSIATSDRYPTDNRIVDRISVLRRYAALMRIHPFDIIAWCLLPNSSETVCRIVLIFGGNVHLMPGQYLIMYIYLSVCPWTSPRLSDFFDNWWKYPGQHIYVGQIILIFGGNIYLTPGQYINYISFCLSVSLSMQFS